MPRQPRLEYPGALYHVTSRTNRGEPLFRAPEVVEELLAALGTACRKTGWRVLAYCVLPDHVHLVLETPLANLVSGMKWWLGTFSLRYNRRHGLRGHLFAARYRALPVDPEGPFLFEACLHVWLNPARAGLLTPEQPLAAYPGSSLAATLQPPEQRPAWLAVDRLLAAAGLPGDTPEARQALAARVEARRLEPAPDTWRALRRGWCFGSERFRAELAQHVRALAGQLRRAPLPHEAQIQLGCLILAEELARRGWAAEDLSRRRKTDPEKVAIAQRLRRETPLSLRWIATTLHMGSPYTLRNALIAAERGTLPTPAALGASTPPPPPTPERDAAIPRAPQPPPPASPAAPRDDFSVAWD
jgi:REP element-mobilizing transposase RayT